MSNPERTNLIKSQGRATEALSVIEPAGPLLGPLAETARALRRQGLG